MNRSGRVLVLLALVGVIGAPIATLHPVAMHLYDAGHARVPHQVEDGAILALLMLVGASLVPLAHSIVRVARSAHRLAVVQGLDRISTLETTADGISYRLVPMAEIVFVTVGILRPEIYASTGARDGLDPFAFRAGLLHERVHKERRDVAWKLVLTVLEAAFRWVPGVGRALTDMALDFEFAADQAALRSGAGRRHLFDAMVAASTGALPSTAMGLSAVGTMERLTVLVEPARARTTGSRRPLIVGVSILAVIPLAAHVLFWVGAVCL